MGATSKRPNHVCGFARSDRTVYVPDAVVVCRDLGEPDGRVAAGSAVFDRFDLEVEPRRVLLADPERDRRDQQPGGTASASPGRVAMPKTPVQPSSSATARPIATGSASATR